MLGIGAEGTKACAPGAFVNHESGLHATDALNTTCGYTSTTFVNRVMCLTSEVSIDD